MSISKVKEMESSGDVKGLVGLLEDKDPHIRYNVAVSLAVVGGTQIFS